MLWHASGFLFYFVFVHVSSFSGCTADDRGKPLIVRFRWRALESCLVAWCESAVVRLESLPRGRWEDRKTCSCLLVSCSLCCLCPVWLAVYLAPSCFSLLNLNVNLSSSEVPMLIHWVDALTGNSSWRHLIWAESGLQWVLRLSAFETTGTGTISGLDWLTELDWRLHKSGNTVQESGFSCDSLARGQCQE